MILDRSLITDGHPVFGDDFEFHFDVHKNHLYIHLYHEKVSFKLPRKFFTKVEDSYESIGRFSSMNFHRWVRQQLEIAPSAVCDGNDF